jgi:hypothetical protein
MLQFASLTGFVRTILILLLVYYGVKIVSRLLAPYLLRYVSKKAEQRFGGQFRQYQEPKQGQRKEGEVSIDKMPSAPKPSNNDVGEYVDYEEID